MYIFNEIHGSENYVHAYRVYNIRVYTAYAHWKIKERYGKMENMIQFT
jgi:hypothetical protein